MSHWTGTYTWRLENFSDITEAKRYSPVFEIGGYTWGLLLLPRGKAKKAAEKFISLYLDLHEPSSTPMQSWPTVFFELIAHNLNNPAASVKREVKHMFTIKEPNWGITRFIRLQESGKPTSDLLVNDSLTLTVNISILDKGTQASLQDTEAESEWNAPSDSTHQPLVFLDVGGESFKMTKSTLARFPNSLLAKMVQEFPSIVEHGEPLFIDRNPKAFPWIQEIYRDGDIENAAPQMSKELLQKELDFYQMPSAEELGIELLPLVKLQQPVQSPMVELFYEILAEIKTCSLWDQESLSLFVYHKREGNHIEFERRVLIMPPSGYQITEYVVDRGHGAFDRAIFKIGGEFSVSKCSGGKIVQLPDSVEQYRIVEFTEEGPMLEILNEEAAKFRMVFSPSKMRLGPHGKRSDIGYLKMQYK